MLSTHIHPNYKMQKDYDEYGVREVRLTMINLAAYRDFADYLDYIHGKKLV